MQILAHEVLAEPYVLIDADSHEVLGEEREIYAAGTKVAALAAKGAYVVHEVLAASRAYHVRNADRPKYAVYDEDGCLVAEYRWPPAVGEKLKPEGSAYRFLVEAVDGHRVTARRILAAPHRLLDAATKELLGHTVERYDIADAVAEIAGKEYRVIEVQPDAYLIKAAKPRVVGPVAATQEQTA